MKISAAGIFYQMPSMLCIARLTREMPSQQQKPVKIGFTPVFTSCMMFVFSPIAAIAMMIRNVLSCLSGAVTVVGS